MPRPRRPLPPPAPRRGRTRSRGGGWLLPEPSLPRFPREPDSALDTGPEPPRTPGYGLARLEAVLDPRSATDRCRWLRLQAEAARWVAPTAPDRATGVTRDE